MNFDRLDTDFLKRKDYKGKYDGITNSISVIKYNECFELYLETDFKSIGTKISYESMKMIYKDLGKMIGD